MNPARNITFSQWAQQIYGPPVMPILNAHNVVEYLVRAKHLRDSSPPKQPSPTRSFYGTSTTLGNESHFTATTQKTTHESLATTDPTRLRFATNNKNSPMKHTEAAPQQNLPKPAPGPRPGEMDQWMYGRLSRIEQLEYLVRLKIKTFREHMQVPYVLRNTQLRRIDREEVARRRKFFKKNGEEAYLARYINSNYTGRVEFLYIDLEEVY